jgi:ATP-dependent protease ClpP protease subunit
MKILTTLIALMSTAALANTTHFKLGNNTVFLGSVTQENVDEVIGDMNRIFYGENPSDEATLYIRSNGGSVVSGHRLISAMHSFENEGKKINCIAERAISMGFVIFEMCKERYVMNHTILMQHQMSSASKGAIHQMNSYSNFLNSLNRQIDTLQADRIGLSLAEFQERTQHDWWIYGQDAFSYNLADGDAFVTCEASLVDQLVLKREKLFIFEVEYYVSRCPLISETKRDLKFVDATEDTKNNRELLLDNMKSELDLIFSSS